MENELVLFTNIETIDNVYVDDENQAHIVCNDACGRNNVIVMHCHLLITAYNMAMDAVIGQQENAE